jgi:hypothetical protein
MEAAFRSKDKDIVIRFILEKLNLLIHGYWKDKEKYLDETIDNSG